MKDTFMLYELNSPALNFCPVLGLFSTIVTMVPTFASLNTSILLRLIIAFILCLERKFLVDSP